MKKKSSIKPSKKAKTTTNKSSKKATTKRRNARMVMTCILTGQVVTISTDQCNKQLNKLKRFILYGEDNPTGKFC